MNPFKNTIALNKTDLAFCKYMKHVPVKSDCTGQNDWGKGD